MKKYLLSLLWCAVFSACAQTFPVGNLQVNGASTFAGTATFSVPILPSSGGVGVLPSCSSPGNALSYTTGATALTCNTSLFSSPSLTGNPTAPTRATGNNSTAIATTAYVANEQPCASIIDYGGDPTGAANNDTAFTNTVAAVQNPSGQVCVMFPPGTYKFASSPTYTIVAAPGGLTLAGSGAETTILYFPASNGPTINLTSPYQSFHIRNMAITTGTASTYNGVTVTQSSPEGAFYQSNVDNVTFRSQVNAGTGWNNSFSSAGVSAISFLGDYFLNTINAIFLAPSTNSPFYGLDYNIVNCTFFGVAGDFGVVYGSFIQGVQIANSFFVNLGTAVVAPSGETGILEGLQFTGNSVATIGTSMAINTQILQTDISNNLFTSAANNTNTMISLGQTNSTTIVGNTFTGSGGASAMSGIFVQGSVTNSGVTIVGNVFANLNSAVNLTASAKGVTVNSNSYLNNVSGVTNSGGVACPATNAGNCIGTATP